MPFPVVDFEEMRQSSKSSDASAVEKSKKLAESFVVAFDFAEVFAWPFFGFGGRSMLKAMIREFLIVDKAMIQVPTFKKMQFVNYQRPVTVGFTSVPGRAEMVSVQDRNGTLNAWHGKATFLFFPGL